MDIATWNVNSLRAHIDHFVKWTSERQPDVICLQETKVIDKLFPHAEVEAAGYPHRAVYGQPTYNGVAILSKLPLTDVTSGFTIGPEDPQARLIRATVAGVHIFNCYVPNGSPLHTDKHAYKHAWLARLRNELDASDFSSSDEVLVCGDINVALTEADVYDPFESETEVLFTPAERESVANVTRWGLTDSFRKKNPFSSEYSWWAYQGMAFRSNHGYRIDHIFVTKPLMRRCRKVRIDRETRTWDKPSDHAPVIATLRDR